MVKDEKELNRKLTPAEEKRFANYQKKSAELESQGYKKTELTVGLVEANVVAILLAIPLILIFGLIFVKLHSFGKLLFDRPSSMLLTLGIFFFLVIVHELIHGVTWAIFSENHFKDIEFGFIVQALTPYCTCMTPLSKGQYILGALMPLIVLGIIPLIISLIIGSGAWFIIGFLMTMSAGGDILIVFNILKHKSQAKDVLYIDHPTQAGGVIFER